MNAQRGSGPFAFRRNARFILREKISDPHRRIEGLIRRLRDAVEEEFEPCLPGAILADFLQQAVIVSAARFQIEAELDFADFWPGRSDASPENRRFRDDAHGLFDGCGGSPKRPERNPSFLP